MPEFQVVFDSIYDYDLWLCNDLSYFLTLFSSFVAEKMLMSHTILKKLSFLTVAEKMLVANHWLVRGGGAKGTSCRRQRAAHLPRKYPTFAKRRLKYCWSNDFIDIIGQSFMTNR